MKVIAALLLATLLGGCGKGESVANQTQPKAAAKVIAPINSSIPANAADDTPPAPQPMVEPKPLVSRETSKALPTPPDYRAIGTEPFWGVTLRGSTIVLERPDKAPMRFAVRNQSDDRAIRFVGDGFTLTATEGPCSDGMSDAIWSDRVQIAFADGTLKGCGGLREDGP
ncbi:COG3650 family protein [Sphingobium sp. YR768]|uniref:COG3650 family protein n=1 Tax=Sphingobium sp. YR768 TaxID=1884365 RepID=UPI0008D64CB3|nr:hypothetical protein [Sphingobium sp. YR768]SER51560.1 Uncharacterized membrane protein [Sphingobium sp. YR768]